MKKGSTKVSDKSQACMEVLWELTGFRAPQSKRARWDASHEQRWLGAHWTYDSETGRLSMRRPTCEKPLEGMTKRAVYRAAGQFLLFTQGAAEAMSRSHADSMRRISGKWPGWDTVCTDAEQCNLIHDHFKCAQQHWVDCSEEDQNLCLLQGTTKIVVEVDGSQEGHGFLAIDASELPDNGDRDQLGDIKSRVVIADAKAFNEKHLGWHCNRRELTAIAFAIKRIDDIRSLLPSLQVVIIRTDSRVASGQVDPWSRVATKSLERKALLRLRSVVVETVFDWKLHGIKARVQHISGVSNVTADKLSRAVSERRYQEAVLEGRERPTVVSNVNLLTTTTLEEAVDGLTRISIPSFLRFVDLHSTFQAWRGAITTGSSLVESDNNEKVELNTTTPPDDLRKRWLRKIQADDDETAQAIAQLKEPTHDPTTPTPINGYLYNLFIDDDDILKRRTMRGSLASRTGQADEHIQTVMPKSIMAEVATAVHAELGHAGFLATFREVSQHCWSPKCREIVKTALSRCMSCIRTVPKASNVLKAFPGPAIIPQWPFQIVGADLFGPIRLRSRERQKAVDDEAQKGTYILTVTDRLTGYCRFELLANCRSQTVIRAFERIICWELCADTQECWTDRGSQFMSSAWGSMCLLSNIRHRVNLPSTPHLGGWWETHHKPLTKCLRSLFDSCPTRDLQEMVSIAQARINSSLGTDSRPSAHELVYGWGWRPCLPLSRLLAGERQLEEDYSTIYPTILPEDPLHREQAVQEAISRGAHRRDLLALFNEA
ncbi:gag/pol/env polyprotein, putative [Perkinsus marinus ATCC 50983]|uniref:Gag/pol/env polyprotein, putative n=1 Tax=Perkinsus marinus (strain ATCC 50983 / TXsc) TaxID=423536 RepID=C5KEZ1_PERM5|nr:gag/pol/env polyprotein, putative [Perkinsus marinus ATCC 50983]EER16952.1 gag/pol/env polyprotein, putative [Perkinsus marinus ATCC 50983]|eukprot:XP_002785156.1 gag/pol/env polyprotein, putative [Perkinsus marinus ATCC 50983]